MFCPKCRAQVEDGAKSCPHCGNRFTETPAEDSPTPPTLPSESEPAHRSFRLTTGRSSRPRSRTIGVGLLLGIMGIAAAEGVMKLLSTAIDKVNTAGTSSPSHASQPTAPLGDPGTQPSAAQGEAGVTTVAANTVASSGADGLGSSSIAGQAVSTTDASGPATKWTLSTTTDKLTDKPTLKALATARVDDNPQFTYEFMMTCSDGAAHVAISTFMRTQPRIIGWKTARDWYPEASRAQLEAGSRLSGLSPSLWDRIVARFTFRVDDEKAKETVLEMVYSNGGTVGFGTVGTTADAPLFKKLPATRFVIGNLFPDETVEFSFTGLTAKERDDIHRECFEAAERATVAAEKAAAAKKAEDDELRPFREGLKIGDAVGWYNRVDQFETVQVVGWGDDHTVRVGAPHTNEGYLTTRQRLFPVGWGETHQKR